MTGHFSLTNVAGVSGELGARQPSWSWLPIGPRASTFPRDGVARQHTHPTRHCPRPAKVPPIRLRPSRSRTPHTRFPDAFTTVTPSANTAPFVQGVLLQLARPAGPAIATTITAKPFRPNRRSPHHPLTAHRMPDRARFSERRAAVMACYVPSRSAPSSSGKTSNLSDDFAASQRTPPDRPLGGDYRSKGVGDPGTGTLGHTLRVLSNQSASVATPVPHLVHTGSTMSCGGLPVPRNVTCVSEPSGHRRQFILPSPSRVARLDVTTRTDGARCREIADRRKNWASHPTDARRDQDSARSSRTDCPLGRLLRTPNGSYVCFLTRRRPSGGICARRGQYLT